MTKTAEVINTANAITTAVTILAPLISEVILDLKDGTDPEEIKKQIEGLREFVAQNRKRNREIREEIINPDPETPTDHG